MARQSHGQARRTTFANGGHRRPLDLKFNSPFLNFKVDKYTGKTPPWVLFALWFAIVGALGIFVLVVSFGAVFGLFGLVGPSLLETLALLVVIGAVGQAFKD